MCVIWGIIVGTFICKKGIDWCHLGNMRGVEGDSLWACECMDWKGYWEKADRLGWEKVEGLGSESAISSGVSKSEFSN